MPSGVYERTPEHRAAASAALLGVPKSPEHCAALSAASLGVPKSPEHIVAMSEVRIGIPRTSQAQLAADKANGDRLRGVPRSPEDCKAISEGLLNSDAIKANGEKMRGGNDIVKHHFIYDHANPDNHTVEITRSQHTAHHNWMRRNGLEVPHINMEA